MLPWVYQDKSYIELYKNTYSSETFDKVANDSNKLTF